MKVFASFLAIGIAFASAQGVADARGPAGAGAPTPSDAPVPLVPPPPAPPPAGAGSGAPGAGITGRPPSMRLLLPGRAPAPAAVRAAHPRPRALAHKAPPAPALPSPDVHMTLDAPTLDGPWTVRVTNAGAVPVRLTADARLLELDVTPRGARKPTRCELPADMRPSDGLDRALVLPPGRSYSETFEPRLYCFGERAMDALAPQAIVVARLGWTHGTNDNARLAVSAIDGIEPALASLPSIEAPPIALPDDLTPSFEAAAPVSAQEDARGRLRVTGSRAVDAETLGGISVTVTVHNDGSRPVRVRFRPETLAFDVTSGVGTEACVWPEQVSAAMRDLFTTIRPHGEETLAVLLSDYCSRRAFDRAGLLVVRPELDTRHAAGDDVGIAAFTGRVIATVPTVVRLHQGTGSARLRRPRLEPLPGGSEPVPPSVPELAPPSAPSPEPAPPSAPSPEPAPPPPAPAP